MLRYTQLTRPNRDLGSQFASKEQSQAMHHLMQAVRLGHFTFAVSSAQLSSVQLSLTLSILVLVDTSKHSLFYYP